MKIFYWSRVSALMEHSDGMVVAFALTKEEAVSLAVLDYGHDDKQPYGRAPYESCAALEKELKDKEPEVFDGPKAFVIRGSA